MKQSSSIVAWYFAQWWTLGTNLYNMVRYKFIVNNKNLVHLLGYVVQTCSTWNNTFSRCFWTSCTNLYNMVNINLSFTKKTLFFYPIVLSKLFPKKYLSRFFIQKVHPFTHGKIFCYINKDFVQLEKEYL
jgi:hypothetical protein